MRVFVIGLVLSLGVILPGCGSSDESTVSTTELSNETVDIDGFDIPVQEVADMMRELNLTEAEAIAMIQESIAIKNAQESR